MVVSVNVPCAPVPGAVLAMVVNGPPCDVDRWIKTAVAFWPLVQFSTAPGAEGTKLAVRLVILVGEPTVGSVPVYFQVRISCVATAPPVAPVNPTKAVSPPPT